MKRLRLLPTLIVAAAVVLMIGLGIWQIHRADWKAELLARYQSNRHLPPIAYPAVPTPADRSLLFRRASGHCLAPVSWSARAGRNRAGEPGWNHMLLCRTGAEGPGMAIDLGWSRGSDSPRAYKGGYVSGVIAASSQHIIMLVADNPASGLQPSAPPSMADIPNNHLAYAVQWFLFAAVAVVIYGFAVRRQG